METGQPTYRIDSLNVQAQRESHLIFADRHRLVPPVGNAE